ncbi:MAG: type II secretion system ATPase GspE [Proteobacteria bacterium]|nr:type II secretion system ATPase GspE [Pseudomonadota bacterium]
MTTPLSQILSEKFGIPESQIDDAQKSSLEKREAFHDVLLKRKIVTEQQLLDAWGLQYGFPVVLNLPMEHINTDFTQKLSIQFLKKFYIVPIVLDKGENTRALNRNQIPDDLKNKEKLIAVHNPTVFQHADDVAKILGFHDFHIVLSTKDAILSVINLSYDKTRDSAQQLVQDMEEEESSSTIISEIEETADLLDSTSDAPIIKLMNHIISQSIKARASDIHLEPYQDSFKVRYRVDGILYDLVKPPKWIQASLISRVKVMAKLDIAEKRLPQDGRIEVKIGKQDVDIRVSTVPTSFGERVVLRLLNKSESLLQLSELGIKPHNLDVIHQLIHLPNGIILVTGPTGSGKTTTLYAILSEIHSDDINIITIEDPVEYQIKGIGQIQVNRKIDLTFAKGLRSIVRQDPDVILVGEIRDQETAEIAIQSALTGHLVFSTLHTNDSASAITRLVDIGTEPFLIASAIKAVIAQRLVRVLCSKCKLLYAPDEMEIQSIGIKKEELENATIFKATGCPDCFNTGYKGRMSIFEIMVLNDNLKRLVLKTHDSNKIKSEAIKQNMITLRQDGKEKVLKGITTIEEVVRVTHE